MTPPPETLCICNKHKALSCSTFNTFSKNILEQTKQHYKDPTINCKIDKERLALSSHNAKQTMLVKPHTHTHTQTHMHTLTHTHLVTTEPPPSLLRLEGNLTVGAARDRLISQRLDHLPIVEPAQNWNIPEPELDHATGRRTHAHQQTHRAGKI